MLCSYISAKLNFSKFEFKVKFEKTKIKILSWSLKAVKGTELKLFVFKMDEIGQNILFNFVYYHGILFMTVYCCSRLQSITNY